MKMTYYEEIKREEPLTGRYAKLRDDLKTVLEMTEYLEATEDGGTCNFDAPVLHLDRWNGKKIEQAAKEAGTMASRWTHGSRTMGWIIEPASSGQGNRRTRRAEAICDGLKKLGYSAGMYYQCD